MIALAELVEVDPLGPRPGDAGENEARILASSNLDVADGALRDVARASPRAIPSTARAVREKDVLFATTPDLLGAAAVATELPDEPTFALAELIVLRPKGNVDPDWIRAFLARRAVGTALKAELTATTDPRLLAATFLPRLRLEERSTEERRLALTVIEDIQTCTKLRARALRRLGEVPGLLVEDGEATPFVTLLDHSADFATSEPVAAEANTPVLSAADVVDGRIRVGETTATAAASGVPLRGGDVLLVTDADSDQRIGDAALYDGEPPGALAGSGLQRVRLIPGMDSHYLWAWLRSPDGRAQLSAVVRPSGSGRRYVLSLNELLGVRVPRPPIDRQRRVGTLARECRLLAGLADRQYQRLQKLREVYEDDLFGPLEVGPALAPRTGGDVLVSLKAALSPAQRAVWDRVTAQPQPVSALAEVGQTERVRRTLELLERVGVVVRDTTGDVEGWRQPFADTELLESA